MRVQHNVASNARTVNALDVDKRAQFGEEGAPLVRQILHNLWFAARNNKSAARLAFHTQPFAVQL